MSATTSTGGYRVKKYAQANHRAGGDISQEPSSEMGKLLAWTADVRNTMHVFGKEK
jgi:hypothetical protein